MMDRVLSGRFGEYVRQDSLKPFSTSYALWSAGDVPCCSALLFSSNTVNWKTRELAKEPQGLTPTTVSSASASFVADHIPEMELNDDQVSGPCVTQATFIADTFRGILWLQGSAEHTEQ